MPALSTTVIITMNAIQAANNTLSQEIALLGNCGYEIQDNRIVVSIAEISNHRPQGDISGTLAIELWAFKTPQATDTREGHLLAATTIGELYGEHYLSDCRYDLIFQEPPAGKWYFALLLREWTAEGYTTRDQIIFSLPYTTNKPTITRSESDNIINVDFTASKETSVKTVAPVKATAKTKAPEAPKAVSLNEAGLEEIKAVKGISKNLAENIVSTRPFSSLDELLKVKGMGEKLLERIRAYISL